MIRFFIDKVNERKNIKELLVTKNHYLQDGTYTIIGAGKRIVFIDNDETRDFIEKNSVHMTRNPDDTGDQSKLKNLISTYTKIQLKKETSNEFEGSLIMFTRSLDYKIFNFSEKKVMTFLRDNQGYQEMKKTYDTFHRFFPMTFTDFSDEEQAYTENYLDFKPYRLWSDNEKNEAIEAMFTHYQNYFSKVNEQAKQTKQTNSTRTLLENLTEKLGETALVKNLDQIISEHDEKDEWPTVYSHGDLNFNNMLLYEGEYYYIDWEDTGELTFFHDLINVMFVEAMFSDDYSYMTNYLTGIYDDVFKDIFAQFNCEFDENKRLYYVAIYAAERIVNFELDVHRDVISIVLDKYLVALKMLESYK